MLFAATWPSLGKISDKSNPTLRLGFQFPGRSWAYGKRQGFMSRKYNHVAEAGPSLYKPRIADYVSFSFSFCFFPLNDAVY